MTDAKSILVVRLSALGDVVLALPTVDTLRERFPSAHLAFLSRTPYADILRDIRAIDRLHRWDGPGTPLPREVCETSWDLLVDLSATGRSRQLLLGVRAKRRLAARKETARRVAFVRLRAFGGNKVAISSAMDRMAGALAPLGLDRAGRVPRLIEGASLRTRVLLAPGGGRPTKRWPAARFSEIARRLAERRLPILLVGSKEETALLEEVSRGAMAGQFEIFAGAQLGTLPARVATCAVALVNDSGLLHVAEACGVPVVALFGPTHPRLGFAPWRAESIALHNGISCSPCDLHGPETCPLGHHRCLEDLSLEVVWAALEARLPREASV